MITDEPNKKVGYREYELSVASLKDKNGIDKKVYGKVLFRFKSYPEYFYGDELSLSCSLQKPKNSENFNYQNSLNNLNEQIKYNENQLTNLSAQDQTLLDTVVTVRGEITIQSINWLQALHTYFSVYWIVLI